MVGVLCIARRLGGSTRETDGNQQSGFYRRAPRHLRAGHYKGILTVENKSNHNPPCHSKLSTDLIAMTSQPAAPVAWKKNSQRSRDNSPTEPVT